MIDLVLRVKCHTVRIVTGESIIKGTEPRINVEHALHVLEIIEGARKSQETGMRIQLKSKFPWPMV